MKKENASLKTKTPKKITIGELQKMTISQVQKLKIDGDNQLFYEAFVKGIEVGIELEKGKQNAFYMLKQTSETNKLAKTLTKKDIQIDFLGNGTIENKDNKGNIDFRLFIKEYDNLTSGVKTSAAKLLDCFVIKLSEDGINNRVSIPLEEYMLIRKLKDEKEARNQLKKDMEALSRIKFEFKNGKNWANVPVVGGAYGTKNGIIYFTFSEDFLRCIPENQFMYLPKEALQFNDKYNPHSYYFTRQIALHKRINIGKKNENILSVKTIIESSPSMTKYEEVSNRKHYEKIVEPFERDMDAIKSIKWEYVGEQPSTCKEFISSNIKIIWDEYPNINNLVKNKKKHEGIKKNKKIQKKKIKELENQIKVLSEKVGI